MVDADHHAIELDPFDTAQYNRLPAFMKEPVDHRVFTATCLDRAAQDFKAVDRELPSLRNRIFHIRSTLREPSTPPLALRMLWRRDDVDDPISTNGGDTDGTVPLWSAQLAWTPAHQVFNANGVSHADLAEHKDVLDAVAALIEGNPVNLPAHSDTLDVTSEDQVLELLTDVMHRRRDIDELAQHLDSNMQRQFSTMFELT